MAEHQRAHRGVGCRLTEPVVQLLDQRRGQRVAVVRGVQRDARGGPLDRVVDVLSALRASAHPGPQYERGRPSEVWATKLSTISRLTGAMRANRDAAKAAAMPYSFVNPFPPNDCTA